MAGMKRSASDLHDLVTQRPEPGRVLDAVHRQSPVHRVLARAEGMHYEDVRHILDGTAGLWCCTPATRAAAHRRGHRRSGTHAGLPPARWDRHQHFRAERLAALAPGALNHVFFTNSGSEAVDTAMKIVLAYHRQRGANARASSAARRPTTASASRHGTRRLAQQPQGVRPAAGRRTTCAATPDLQRNAFSGLPRQGAELADDLSADRRMTPRPSRVFVEPIAGSAGVILPAPGYLQRLRELCDHHGILLVFDEVITGFSACPSPHSASRSPDLLTFAKAVSTARCRWAACWPAMRIR